MSVGVQAQSDDTPAPTGPGRAPLKQTDERAEGASPDGVGAAFGANVLSLAVPISTIQLYDRIIPSQGYETLTVLGLVVIGAILAEVLLRAARGIILEHAGERFELAACNAAFDAILRADPRHGDPMTRGRLFRDITAIERLRTMHTGPTALAILDLPFVLVFLAVIALISPQIGAVVAGILAATFGVLRIARRKIQDNQNQRKEVEERRHSFLVEALGGIEVIKGMHIEDAMNRRYERLMAGAAEIGASIVGNTHSAQGFAATVGAFAPVLVACIGAFLAVRGEMTVGMLAAIILLTGRIIQPALRVEAFLAGEVASGQERDDLEEIICLPRLHSGRVALSKVNEIEMCAVSSPGLPADGIGFRDVAFSFKRGDCIHLQGPTREACTAFLRLLLGETVISAGAYRINGRPADEYALEDRFSRMRYISCERALMSGTVLENKTGFQTAGHRDDAMLLASEFGIDETLANSSEGHDLAIGAGAKVALSTSLAYTIAIIGGLVGKPDVVLFDQANASLDRATDERLLSLLSEARPSRITILCSNRPSYRGLATLTLDITPFGVAAGNEIHSTYALI